MDVSKADLENFLKTPEALIEITKELSKQK